MSVQSFRTNDVDEAAKVFGQHYHEHRIKKMRNAPLGFSLSVGTIETLTVGTLSYGQEISAESNGLRSYVAVPLKGTFRFGFGRVDVVADPATAAISTPNLPATLRAWSAGDESLFVLGLNVEVLTNHLRGLLGRENSTPIRFSPSLNLRTGAGAQWWQLTSNLARALHTPNGLAFHPMMRAPLANSVMTGLLLATEHSHREALDAWTRPAPPVTVKRAMDFIEQHAHEPLTIVEIAKVAGTSVRALQLSFRGHVDLTPSEYLRRVRMDRVHTMLRFANPESTSVGEIAQSWGFNQLGRFAAQYRKIYGVSPKITLRE